MHAARILDTGKPFESDNVDLSYILSKLKSETPSPVQTGAPIALGCVVGKKKKSHRVN